MCFPSTPSPLLLVLFPPGNSGTWCPLGRAHGGAGEPPPAWWEPSAGARAAVEAEFGGAEEGGEEEEGVCVHVGVESVCRKQPSGSLPCEILIIPASAISAMRSGPPLLNISLTPLTSHCTSPTFLSPIDPSPIAAPRPCHQQQPWPGAPCSIPILDMPEVSPALLQPLPPCWGGSRGRSEEGRSSTPLGAEYKCASTSPLLNNP